MTAAGLAAVLVVAFLTSDLSSPPGSPVRSVETQAGTPAPNWTPAELEAAQSELAFSLALTARVIQKSERTAVHQVFGKKIPHVISGSIRKAINTNLGDQG